MSLASVSGLDSSSTTSARPEPLKMAWITDFTIVCPDKDILVVKECLKKSSKLFKSILEDDNNCNSLPLKWGSLGITKVMKYIHTFPSDLAVMELNMDTGTIDEENMFEFCFQYEIEPALTVLKTLAMDLISNGKSFKLGWLEFFHEFKNKDNAEPFRPQIDVILCRITNDEDNLDLYLELKYNLNDMMVDSRSIIRGLGKRLQCGGSEHKLSSLPARKLIVNASFDLENVKPADWTTRRLKIKSGGMFNCYIDRNSGLVCYNPNDCNSGIIKNENMTALGIWNNETQSYVELAVDAVKYARRLWIGFDSMALANGIDQGSPRWQE